MLREFITPMNAMHLAFVEAAIQGTHPAPVATSKLVQRVGRIALSVQPRLVPALDFRVSYRTSVQLKAAGAL